MLSGKAKNIRWTFWTLFLTSALVPSLANGQTITSHASPAGHAAVHSSSGHATGGKNAPTETQSSEAKPAQPAAAEPVKQNTAYPSDDLTLKEAQDAFIDFNILPTGGPADNATHAQLIGTYFDECVNGGSSFDVTHKTVAGHVLIEIVDPNGHFRECEKQHIASGYRCTPQTCKTLSAGGDKYSIDLTMTGDSTVALYHRNTNSLEKNPPVKNEDLDALPISISHVSPQTAAAKIQAARADLIQRRADRDLLLIQTCRGSEENLAMAKEAADDLVLLGKWTQAQEKNEIDKENKDRLNTFGKAIAKISVTGDDTTDLQALKDHLQEFNAQNPGMADQIAGLYYKIALKQQTTKNGGVGAVIDAQSTIQEAATLDGLSTAASARLAGYIGQLEDNKIQQEAVSALTNPLAAMRFQYDFGQYVNARMQTYQDSCSGDGANIEACIGAQTSVQTAMMIPQQAQQQVAQKQKMMADLNARLAQAMNPTQNSTALNLPGPTGPSIPGMNPANASFGPYWGGGQYGNTAFNGGLSSLGAMQSMPLRAVGT